MIALLTFTALADWEAVPDVRMEVEANDNPRLGQNPEERAFEPDEIEDRTATRMLMDARVRLRNEGPRGELMLRPRVRLDTYADEADEDLERQDAYLVARGSYRWPRATIGSRLAYQRESIISAELADTAVIDPQDPALEDPIDTETGLLVQLEEYRNRSVVTPFAELDLSERSALLLEARHLDVSYTGPELGGRTDFSNTDLSIGIGRTIDDRTGVGADLVVSRYRADENDNETDTVGVEGRFSRQLSPLWAFNLTTGLQRSEFSFLEDGERVDNATTNYTMSLAFEKRTELATLDVGLFRLLNPNAVGFLVERNELRLAYRRQLSPLLTLGVGLRGIETGTIESDGRDREYVRADLDLEWAVSPSWSLAVRYGVLDQELTGARLDGTANVISFGAVYRGLARRAGP